ncbi:hypothetical protein RN001_006521 [Aquatica leii]|uniref:Cytochrome P450 n=1 Tax=Aquatica leii TaxID=1421715 RepID=A0AAN7SIM5_9COLE|nr:hypothetical protein RN001_006521 [Aquatica leii]
MWFFILFFILFVTIYRYLNRSYEFWEKHGVPSPPVSLLFGNMVDVLFLRKSLGQLYAQVYTDYPNLRYVGFYKIREPAIIIRDAALIKNMLIKDFSSFHDNDFYIDEKIDPIFAKNPFSLKGEKWKYARNQLTPCFTIKKLKAMFPLVNEVGKRAIKYLNNVNLQGIEAKELSVKYTVDVVASCIFGMEGNSFENNEGELQKIRAKIFTSSSISAIKHVIEIILPFLGRFFNIKFFPDEVVDYFRIVITKSLKYREENNIVRGDFLDNMKELAIKLGNNNFTIEDMVAHAGGMFTDGSETSAIGLSFILFELAVNPEAQNKLRACIDDVLLKNNGDFTYEDIISLQYLDGVFKESLRLHPPFPYLAKVCTKDFKLPSPLYGDDSSYVEIKEGLPVFVPTYAIHRDSKYYTDPEKFMPERYYENENNPFFSFGDGPRFCLGEKFANMQVKTFVAYIIANFEIRLNQKTTLPLKIDPQYFLLKALDGIWLNLYKRN